MKGRKREGSLDRRNMKDMREDRTKLPNYQITKFSKLTKLGRQVSHRGLKRGKRLGKRQGEF
jgi:hypothetical protein